MSAVRTSPGGSSSWGLADFLGGLTVRRAPLTLVTTGSQASRGQGGGSTRPDRQGLLLALTAALCFGAFLVTMDAIGDADLLWVLFVARAAAVVTILLSAALLGERLDPTRRLGVALALCGIALIAAG